VHLSVTICNLVDNVLLERCLKLNVAKGLSSTARVLDTLGRWPLAFLNLRLIVSNGALRSHKQGRATHDVAVSRAVPLRAFSGTAFRSSPTE
jgi:hypothetical protein